MLTVLAPGTDPGLETYALQPRCWPMGFAWSSWVAQTSTLRVCEESGLPVEALLAADNAPPANSDLLFGVATDDVMFFTNGDPAVADRASTRLDEALSRRALVKHLGKDLPAATNQTCVGVDLVDGLRWEAPAAKLAFGFLGSLRLLEAATVCPQVASRWLGTHQWYDLLRRPLLSIFEDTYSFVRAEPALKAVPLPVAVRREILLAAVGCLHWNFDLTAPLSNIVGATDASTSFGLGAATIETDTATAWGLARHTARVNFRKSGAVRSVTSCSARVKRRATTRTGFEMTRSAAAD